MINGPKKGITNLKYFINLLNTKHKFAKKLGTVRCTWMPEQASPFLVWNIHSVILAFISSTNFVLIRPIGKD